MKVIALSGLLLLFAVKVSPALASSSVYGPTNTFVPKASDKAVPIETITCVWPPNGAIGNTLEDDNRVRLALYDAVVSRRGIVKAKMICSTIEGDPIPTYATAKEGKIKVTYDRSKDRHFKLHRLLKLFGGDSFSTRKVEIGYLDGSNFVPLSGSVPGDRRLILRLRKKEYF